MSRRSTPLPVAGWYESRTTNPGATERSKTQKTTRVEASKPVTVPDRGLRIESGRRIRDFERLDQD